MKISVLTPTYNRANLLKKLYESLEENSIYNVEIEWLIMDDGSSDNTKKVVEELQEKSKIEIKYFYQKNQGKMVAINELVGQATGNLIIDCDSDDYFSKDAFKIIKEEYDKNKDEKNIYALCFLKYDTKGKNMGKEFTKKRTTMFDLYFKEGEDGEKALVFFANIRKKYKHELEHGEKFVTEARMYHQIDLNYDMICINKPIMVCEYQDEGYTKNIVKQFKENPYGYYEYFKEILQRDFSGVKFNKRLYAIKHYILFGYLTNNKENNKYIKGKINKLFFFIMNIPGRIMTIIKFKMKK